MNYVLTLMTFLAFVMFKGCGSTPFPTHDNQIDYEKLYNKLSVKLLKEITEKYDVSIRSFGGSFMDEIQMINYGFTSNRAVLRDEARVILVQITEDFIKGVNSFRELRPHFAQYPLSEANFLISITFCDPQTKLRYEPPFVSEVFTVHSKLYYTDEPNKSLTADPDETYEEAKAKVEAYLAQPG